MRWLGSIDKWVATKTTAWLKGVTHGLPWADIKAKHGKPSCYLDLVTPTMMAENCCDDCEYLEDCWGHLMDTLQKQRMELPHGRKEEEDRS